MRDADTASSIVWDPELYHPCLDHAQDSCWPQYIFAIIFGIIGLLALLVAYFVFKTWMNFSNAGRRSRSSAPAARSTPMQGGDSWGLTVMKGVDKIHPYVGTSFAAGGKWFWYRAWSTLVTEVGFQIMRGFLLYDAYARVSALQTLAQTVLIVLHINVFVLCFHRGSEVASVFTGLCFEIAYLAVRVTIFGRLSLRTTSFWDMLTIAGPLLITVSELYEILHFITYGSIPSRPSESHQRFFCQRKAGLLLLLLVIIVTGVGAFVSSIVIRTGFMEECPRAYGTETRPDDYLLPSGVDCYVWQYNMFLAPAPACSCIYLSMNLLASDVCAGLGANDHEAISDLIPHLDDVRFLNVWKVVTSGCSLSSKDFELFASLRRLQAIILEEVNYLQEFPTFFGQWEDLRSFEIEWSDSLRAIDKDVVEKWTRLERFACWDCNTLDSVRILREVQLPRLNWVLVHGVKSCDGFESFSGDFSCTEMNAPNTCGMFPEYRLQSKLDSVRIARERTTCAKDICHSHNYDFGWVDRDNDGQLNYEEFRMHEWSGNYSTSAHECHVSAIRNVLAQGYQEDYEGVDVSTFLTYIEHMASRTKYSTCADCPFSVEILQKRKQFYDDLNAIDKSDVCWMIEQYGQGAFSVESLAEACRKVESSCHPAVCPTALNHILKQDQVITST